MQPLLEMRSIGKRFGGVKALYDVDITLYPGQVVGLVGDNGAGKSTLVKIIAGAHRPNDGTIRLEGREVELSSPSVARALGIETVYQDLALVDTLDVVENIFLGREILKRNLLGLRILDRRRMRMEAEKLLKGLGVHIPDLRVPVRGLSGGQRQSVAISRAMLTKPKLVLLDEPTAALAVQEVEKVLKLINTLREQGIGVVLISHTLQHVMAVSDRIVVLRRGTKVFDTPTRETDMSEVVAYIIGGESPVARGKDG